MNVEEKRSRRRRGSGKFHLRCLRGAANIGAACFAAGGSDD